jgi:UDP-N-acetylmuramyl pentapeptide phosphotransferase/UDP-N-acetylglucosamine-1-phosphate transferase
MYGLTGFIDDYWKVKRQNSNAMTAKMKLFLQFLTATLAACIITAATPRGVQTVLNFPNFENILLIVLLFGFPLIFEFCLLVDSGGSFPKNNEERMSIHALVWPLCLALYVLIGPMMYKNGNSSFTGAINTMIDLISGENSNYHLPTIKRFFINLSWLYVPFAVIVISGTSNAVNLSDGLDGLASGLLIIAFTFFGIVAYFYGLHNAIDYNALFIPRCGEIAVVCGALVGSCLGFLYFNKPKARVFMGDTGSLALGAILGAIAVMTKHEVLLAIVGGVFVAETVSVMIQVLYFKSTGKRFFKMAPIHHHFEQLGWSEKKVVFSFWTTALALALLGSLIFI